jgi:type VI secretion system protein ImpJ
MTKLLSRLVWSEGMHLAQHHFQTLSRYFEDSMAFAVQHLFFRPYGFVGCELDADAVRNGTVALVHARGVMPDGLTFHFPDCDPLPASRDIRELFSPTDHSLPVALVIPPYRPGGRNCELDAAVTDGQARYVAETQPVSDELGSGEENPVQFGRKNFRLLVGSEIPDDAVSLPIARIRRDGTGHFEYEPEFISPCLQVGASRRLLEVLGRVVDMLDAKSEALAHQRREEQQPLADFAAHEVARFWLAHTIHSALGPLRHHLASGRSSPEQVYADLARLAGALYTFSLEGHPRELPLYDHDNLGQCFAELDRQITASLDIVIATNCLKISLERTREFLFAGKVADARCLGPSRWVLGVSAQGKAAQIISGVPRLVKVCSGAHIVRLVKEGLPALELEHLPAPPAAVAPRIGWQYFAIKQDGPCWQAITQGRDVGVYVPDTVRVEEIHIDVVLS